MHGLTSVDFATHIQLRVDGFSDLFAVHTQVITVMDQEDSTVMTHWRSGIIDKWTSIQLNWGEILSGEISDPVYNINDVFLTLKKVIYLIKDIDAKQEISHNYVINVALLLIRKPTTHDVCTRRPARTCYIGKRRAVKQ